MREPALSSPPTSTMPWVLPRHLTAKDVWLTVTPVWAALALGRVLFYELERLRFPAIVPPVLADAIQGLILWPIAVLGCHLTLKAWRRAGVTLTSFVGLTSTLGFGVIARPAYGLASWMSLDPQAERLWVIALQKSGVAFWYPWLSNTVEYGVLYLSCLSASVGFLAYRNWVSERLLRERADSRAAHERLRTLRTQVNPHFLLNALNSIIGLNDLPIASAQQLLGDLTELLRRTLEASEQEQQPVRDEVAYAEAYLRIQQTRFPSCLQWHSVIDPGCAEAVLPSLILMPLVENAVTHGMRGATPSVRIDIDVNCDSASVSVSIRNSRPQLTDASMAGRSSLGLRHVRERLQLLFGNDASLDIDRSDPTQFVVRLSVPANPSNMTAADAEEPPCES